MAASEEAANSCQFRLRLDRCPVDVEVQAIEVEALLRLKRLFLLRAEMGLSSISVGGGRGHERHRRLAGSAHLAEVRSHAVANAAERGGGAELMNVPGALLRGPDGLRQNCRTADGEVADMGLQTGKDVSVARLDARTQGTDVGGAIPLRGEQPLLRACASGARKQQRRAERDRIKCSPHLDPPFCFLTFIGL